MLPGLFGQNGLMWGQIRNVQSHRGPFEIFDAKEVEGTPPPSWNVAPTQDVPIITERIDEGTIGPDQPARRLGSDAPWGRLEAAS